jgi:cysteine desulfurase/selenocysteine lyase
MSVKNFFGIDFIFEEKEVYLDSATAGKIPQTSIQAMNDFYSKHGGGINRGTHKISLNASRTLEKARTTISEIFSVENTQISFLPSRETAMINALFSQNFEKGNEILSSSLDDHSVIAPLLNVNKYYGTKTIFTNIDDELDLINSFHERINSNTKAIVLSALTLGMGVLRDWKDIASLAEDTGLLFILDISNGIGHSNYDFSKISPDIVISSSNIGALGPYGAAFQIIKNKTNSNFEPALIGGGAVVSVNTSSYKLASVPHKFEPGSLNFASIHGLENSLQLLSNVGFDKIRKHEQDLRRILRENLLNIKNIEIIEKEGLEYGPVISFFSDEIDSHDIAIILEDLANIYVRSGALCSHLFMEEIKKESLVQISTHLYNTEEDINTVLETLDSIMTEI